MIVPRIILGLSALIFVLVGVYYIVAPGKGAAVVGITLDSAMGISDLRAVYGGLDLAVGALLLFYLLQRRLADGLTVQVFAFGGLAFARLVGIVLDRPEESLAITLFAIESLGCTLGILGLRMTRREGVS